MSWVREEVAAIDDRYRALLLERDVRPDRPWWEARVPRVAGEELAADFKKHVTESTSTSLIASGDGLARGCGAPASLKVEELWNSMPEVYGMVQTGRLSLRLIGYWAGPSAPGWPDPRDFVDPAWDLRERETIADYLRGGFVFRAFGGVSTCRLCGGQNGALELSDGVCIGRMGWSIT